MASIQPIICKTVDEYFDTLNLGNSSWWGDNSECSWIFRGQCSNDSLTPSLYRENNKKQLLYQKIFSQIQKNLVDSTPYISPEGIVANHTNGVKEDKRFVVSELIKASFVEIALTESFLSRCNEIRLHTPTLKLFRDQPSELRSVKYFHNRLANNLIKNFIYDADQFDRQKEIKFTRFFDFDYPEAMALARHHGIPSKLLDWTKDPLTAAFFSASNCQPGSNICVWALNQKLLNTCPTNGQIAFYDQLNRSGLEFLHSQKGLFTDMLGVDVYYYTYGKWPTLDEYLLRTYTHPDNQPILQTTYLKKIELSFIEKDVLLKRLDRMGFNKYSLKPSYDNVAQSIIPEKNKDPF